MSRTPAPRRRIQARALRAVAFLAFALAPAACTPDTEGAEAEAAAAAAAAESPAAGTPDPAQEEDTPGTPADGGAEAGGAEGEGAAGAADGRVSLPPDIEWTTNWDDPPIGSAEALRGGTLNVGLGQYPLTFRLMGPNSNDAFAGWNRLFTMNFGLIARHPVTDNFIPWMATHWSVQDDQRTIYVRLDPDARWSDGTPITADDYVFTLEMMRSEYIIDPFYNSYAERFYESIDKIDDHTLRIVGTRESWRPLSDYAGIWPSPSHAIELDEDWVTRTTNEPQVAIGPYVVSDRARGESVTFERVDDWWGDGKHYFQGLWNFDRIHLRVLPLERQLDWMRRGELDLITENSARRWNEDYNFPAVRNGWIRRARVFTETPSGIYGLHMNLEAPVFRDRNVRLAMQHLFNFDRLNRNLMFNEYFQQVSFPEGTEYANPDLEPYPFNPSVARAHLEQAGFRRPDEIRSRSFVRRIWSVLRGLVFTRSDTDDILVNEAGDRLSFSVIYGSPGLARHLTVMQQEYRRAGVDMRLRLLEPGTAFERGLERKYEMTVTARTAGLYPAPRQYLHTEFRDATNNNNIWGFGTAEVDSLIVVYEESLDFEERLAAIHRIDEIVQDEAFYIPFWMAPFIWVVHWDYIRFPEFYLPLRTEQITDWMVYWFDPDRKAAVDAAMAEGRAFPVDDNLDVDHWGVRERFE